VAAGVPPASAIILRTKPGAAETPQLGLTHQSGSNGIVLDVCNKLFERLRSANQVIESFVLPHGTRTFQLFVDFVGRKRLPRMEHLQQVVAIIRRYHRMNVLCGALGYVELTTKRCVKPRLLWFRTPHNR